MRFGDGSPNPGAAAVRLSHDGMPRRGWVTVLPGSACGTGSLRQPTTGVDVRLDRLELWRTGTVEPTLSSHTSTLSSHTSSLESLNTRVENVQRLQPYQGRLETRRFNLAM
jgi:hypothetical protein